MSDSAPLQRLHHLCTFSITLIFFTTTLSIPTITPPHSYRPSALHDIQDGPLVRGMCRVMAASRGVPDYYDMLGFAPGEEATPPMIKRVMRRKQCICARMDGRAYAHVCEVS